MPLLKNNALVSDTWIHAEAEGELPERGRRDRSLRAAAEGMGRALARGRASSACSFGNTDRAGGAGDLPAAAVG